MYLVYALLTFGTLCLLSTVSKDILTNIMHMSVTVLYYIVYVFYVRRSIYRSTGLHGSKHDDDDDDEIIFLRDCQ